MTCEYYFTLMDMDSDRFLFREQKIKERCQKCKKRNFRSRNEDFCSEKCSDESETEDEAVEASSESDTETTTVKARKAGGQKRNNKNKKTKKSKEERQKLRENRKKNRSRKNQNKNKKFSVPLNEDDTIEVKEYVKRKTGPLESFIKFLFKKN